MKKNGFRLLLLLLIPIGCSRMGSEYTKQKEPKRYPEITKEVKNLIDQGKDIDVPQEFCDPNSDIGYIINRTINRSKYTPLHVAVMFGNLEAVQLLVENSADL